MRMPILAPYVLMSNIVRISSIIHSIGGASGATIVIYLLAGKLYVLILALLVSILILVCSLIVAARSYVHKLALVAQSSVFKRRTVLALK